MKTSIKNAAALLIIVIISVSCRKDPNPKPASTGSVVMTVTNTADSNLLALGKNYKDAHGDTMTVTIFNYYISNIVLTTSTGTQFAEANSYHLLLQNENSTTGTSSFTIAGVPEGTYTSITFMIGVDSLHDVSGNRTGALDPVNGMFWDWNTGYIMAKMEGTYQAAGIQHTYQFHIGGFSGVYNALRSVTLTFPQPIVVTKNGQNMTYFHANALNWYKGPQVIDLTTFQSTTTPNTNSVIIANNYANMFGIDSVK